ncbi:Predicted soluble lytic transglycosylase fused to an ABC-type amino acid-binding protein [Maritimibacter sp. HL-12]|jgi:hypothetical protein|nr:Predicted soluble lytic transglycosylase fused to an ABC-type amino acid-binding protein [Maritimibacter sp. HL-12]
MTIRTGLMATALLALAGCAGADFDTVFSSKSPATEDLAMRWDHRPEADRWTETTLAALDAHGAGLVSTMPADIDTWCPAYKSADAEGRKVFWTGLLSTLAKHESTWNPAAVGGGGKWFGLVQIAPATARGYGCEARSGEALKNGEANLSCAVKIMNVTVPRDGVVSQGMRGVAADWGPFHSATKRGDMINWMRAQPYCAG